MFGHCSGLVLSCLHGQVRDRHRVGGVLAGTFVEVWWLARFHVDPDIDVMEWIAEIVQRRVTDSRSAAPAAPAAYELDLVGIVRAHGVEAELAMLLSRRPAPPWDGLGPR
jgi:hypothetical protein